MEDAHATTQTRTNRTLASKKENAPWVLAAWQLHNLDDLKEEVIEVDQRVAGQIQSLPSKATLTHERLKALLATEPFQEDITHPFNVADQQAIQIIEGRFGNRKHH